MRDARQLRVSRTVDDERYERRRRLHVPVAEDARELIAGPIASCLWQRSTTCGEHNKAGAIDTSVPACEHEVVTVVCELNT
jgi:hypothetical protein